MSNTRLFWIDLETEGFDEKECGILEAGVIITNLNLTVIEEKSWVIKPYSEWTPDDLMTLNPFVFRMHQSSGLLDEVVKDGISVSMAAIQIRTLANKHGVGQDKSDPMCGNTVHFDRRFIKEHMPGLDGGFSHRIIDVSSEKEEVRRYRPEWLRELEARPDRQVKAHRALDDIRQSINEFRFYRTKRGDL